MFLLMYLSVSLQHGYGEGGTSGRGTMSCHPGVFAHILQPKRRDEDDEREGVVSFCTNRRKGGATVILLSFHLKSSQLFLKLKREGELLINLRYFPVIFQSQ